MLVIPEFLESVRPAIEFHDKLSGHNGWLKYPIACRKFIGQMLWFASGILKKTDGCEDFEIKWSGRFKYKNAEFYSDDRTYINERGEKKELTLEVLHQVLRAIPLEIIDKYLRYDVSIRHVKKIEDRDLDIHLVFDEQNKISVPINSALSRCRLIRDMFCEFKSISEIHIPISCSRKLATAFIDIIKTGRIVSAWLPEDSNELPKFFEILDFLGMEY